MHAQCACCAHCLHGRHGADGRRCGLPWPARRRCFSRTTRCTTTTSTTTRCRCNVQDAAKMQVQHGDYERFDRSRRAWAALSDPSGRAMPSFAHWALAACGRAKVKVLTLQSVRLRALQRVTRHAPITAPPAPLVGQKHHFCCRLRPGMFVALPLPAAPANSLPQRPLSFRLVAQVAKSRQNGKDRDDLLRVRVLALDDGR